MREAYGDAWELSSAPDSILAITTNGYIKSNGCAVMGRGIAAEARRNYPGMDSLLGHLLTHGNHVYVLSEDPAIVSFPVKHHWGQMADIDLILRSAAELIELLDSYAEWDGWTVYLPRPGCGNGGLDWEMVRPIIEPVLDDRFVVIDKARLDLPEPPFDMTTELPGSY